jgi:hypothetical protein
MQALSVNLGKLRQSPAESSGGFRPRLMEWSPLPETASKCHSGKRDDPLSERGDEMEITTVGLDLAKNIIQVHAINQHGKAVLKKSLKRDQILPFFANLTPCLIGIEACSSAHYGSVALAS